MCVFVPAACLLFVYNRRRLQLHSGMNSVVYEPPSEREGEGEGERKGGRHYQTLLVLALLALHLAS